MMCIENIKAIATAIEYYAKDNNGKFPAKLRQLIPRYLKSRPVCPVSGDDYIYAVDGDKYEIKVPDPSKYGMEVLMFSSDRGWVTK